MRDSHVAGSFSPLAHLGHALPFSGSPGHHWKGYIPASAKRCAQCPFSLKDNKRRQYARILNMCNGHRSMPKTVRAILRCSFCSFQTVSRAALMTHERSCRCRHVCHGCKIPFQSSNALNGHRARGGCSVPSQSAQRKRHSTHSELKQLSLSASPLQKPSGKRRYKVADTSDVAHSEDVTPLCALPAPPPPLSLHAVADTMFAVKPRRLTSVELACEFESFAEYIAETRLPRGDHAEVGRSYYFTV